MVPHGYTGPAWMSIEDDTPPEEGIKVWVNSWDSQGFAWYETLSESDPQEYPALPEDLAIRK